MKRRSLVALGWSLIVLLTMVGWQEWTVGRDRSPDQEDEPLLLLEDEPPLLLDDGDGDAPSAAGRPVADNSRCHVCHLDYADEEIAVVHAKANLGCTKCHGNCDEHIADESWASGGNGTPPEKMYRRHDIDPCCEKCHMEHDIPARDVVARWLQRRSKVPKKLSRDQAESAPRPSEKTTADRLGIDSEEATPNMTVCTDCHGHHRLKGRKCKWK